MMNTATPRSARATLPILCLAALSLSAARADQPSTATPGELESITVFGSRVKARTVFDSAVPIDVFNAAEVQQALSSGELGQALQSLSPSVNMPRASASGTSDSVRTIQLRGLAPDQVLVLVNGKRRHTNAVMDIEGLFPGTVAVDLNAIPQESIDHIEILRDGAGAIYGSDAIAGVVNIVLKSGAHGGDLDAAYGENRTHFAPTGQTLTDGRNKTVDFDYGLPLGDTGSFRFGADYQKRGSTNRAGRTDSSFASYYNTPADQALDQQVVFRSGDPELTNKSLFYNADLPLSGGATVYSFATLNWRDTKGAAFFRYPGDPTNVPALYPSGFLPVSTGVGRDAGLVVGARGGEASGWQWDLSAREGYNTFGYGLEHSLNASLGAASPTNFHVADFTYEERALNFDLTRQLPVTGLRSPLNVLAGAEYMHQAYHSTPGDPASYAQGDPTLPPGSQGDNGLRPQDAVHLSRHVTSVYLDVDNELSRQFLIGVAGRYSKYSDYGSSTTGKFSVRYNLTDDFLWRGAVSNSFRAPSLAQTGLRLTTLNLNSTGNGLQTTAFIPPTDALAQLNGGLALKPEKSVNYTTGVAWRATAAVEATLDVYQIKIKDRITPTGQFPVSDPVNNPDLSAVTFLTNGLDTTTRGLDAVISQRQRVSGGELKLSAAFNRNYNHQDGLRNALVNQGLNAPVVVPLLYGSPATKLVLSIDWANEQWGAYVKPIRYGKLSAFTYDSNEPSFDGGNAQHYEAAWTVDAEVHATVGTHTTLALGGSNLFNRYPNQTTPGGTYGGSFPYNFIHPVGLNGAYFYLRLAVKLPH